MSQKEQVELAKELLNNIRHVAVATVNEDGSPHNSPVFKMIDDELKTIYVGSYEESLHSQNLLRTGQAFVVIFDAHERGKGGIYLTCNNVRLCDDDELEVAMKVSDASRARFNKAPLDIEYYQRTSPSQRMYRMDITKIELYSSRKDPDGHIIYEERKEVKADELL